MLPRPPVPRRRLAGSPRPASPRARSRSQTRSRACRGAGAPLDHLPHLCSSPAPTPSSHPCLLPSLKKPWSSSSQPSPPSPRLGRSDSASASAPGSRGQASARAWLQGVGPECGVLPHQPEPRTGRRSQGPWEQRRKGGRTLLRHCAQAGSLGRAARLAGGRWGHWLSPCGRL